MKTKSTLVWSLGILLFCFGKATPSMAAPTEVPADRPLTLNACVAIALEKNPLQEAARQGVIAAEEAVGKARAPYYPQLDLDAGFGRRQSHAFLPAGLSGPDRPDTIGPTDDWSAGLAARLLLFDSGKRRAELLAADAARQEARAADASSRQDLILNVHRAYFGLAAALENQRVIASVLERAAENLRLAEELHEAGAVPLADVLRARVEHSTGLLSQVRAGRLIQICRATLNQAMGLPAEAELTLAAAAETEIHPPPAVTGALLDGAEANRPVVREASYHLERADQSVAAARSAFGPRLGGLARYGVRDEEFPAEDRDWYTGVTLELPLFAGFAQKHSLAANKAEQAAAAARLMATKQAVRTEAWNAAWTLKEKFEALQAAEPLVAHATESQRLARLRYENGVGTMADLLAAQVALAEAETIRVTSRFEYRLADAELRRARGELDGNETVQGLGGVKAEKRTADTMDLDLSQGGG